MLKSLTSKTELLTNDVDYLKRMKLSSVLDIFQEIASEHARLLDCGFYEMAQRDMFWVLSRVKFEILSQPKYKDNIEVTTWPTGQGNVFFERDYIVKCNGQTCIKASSVWCVLSASAQKIIPAKNADILKMDFISDRALDSSIAKISKKGHLLWSYTRHVLYSDLDFNNHVNNIRYADFMFDGLKSYVDKQVVSMQINYQKQVKIASVLDIEYYKTSDNAIYIAINCEGELMCEGELIFLS